MYLSHGQVKLRYDLTSSILYYHIITYKLICIKTTHRSRFNSGPILSNFPSIVPNFPISVRGLHAVQRQQHRALPSAMQRKRLYSDANTQIARDHTTKGNKILYVFLYNTHAKCIFTFIIFTYFLSNYLSIYYNIICDKPLCQGALHNWNILFCQLFLHKRFYS